MKGKKDMRQVDIERLIFVVQGITYIHTLSLRTYAAAIVLKMAKVDGNNTKCQECHTKTHITRATTPRSQSSLSKTRHNKTIRKSGNTVQRVSACFVVVTCVVLTHLASQTPLLHVDQPVQKPLTHLESDDEHAHETSWQPSY